MSCQHQNLCHPGVAGMERDKGFESFGLDPSNFLLRQWLKGDKKVAVGLDDTVCFTEPGIERFVTIPKDPKDGSNS